MPDFTVSDQLPVTIWDRLLGTPLMIAGIVVIALFLRLVVHRAIRKVTAMMEQRSAERVTASGRATRVLRQATGLDNERRKQRAATVGSLLRSISTVLIFTIAALTIMAELGVPLAPLLTSAGIGGVALGFGAQSLVKDFLSGIFMIMEDQYGVGDVIDVGTANGTVEAVGLRVTRIRDVDGTVWYVRNGEIRAVGNQSQNWAQAVLDFRIAFTENIDRVKEILTEVAREIFDDPDHSEDVLEPPEVWGVQAWDEDAVVVRVVLKTAPLRQWEVGRQMRERVKERFDEENIEIPLPQRVVWQRHDHDQTTASGGDPA